MLSSRYSVLAVVNREGFRYRYPVSCYNKCFVGVHVQTPDTRQDYEKHVGDGGFSLETLNDTHPLFVAPTLEWLPAHMDDAFIAQSKVFMVEFDFTLVAVTGCFQAYQDLFGHKSDAKKLEDRYPLTSLGKILIDGGVQAFYYTGEDGETPELAIFYPKKRVLSIEQMEMPDANAVL